MSDSQTPDADWVGVVLAAGFGKRLRPLTDKRPKPLMLFCGAPLLHLHLAKMASLQCPQVIVNSHHLHTHIAKAVATFPTPPPIHLSHETAILGTGGAYALMADVRAGRPLLVINGDIITTFPAERLLAQHLNSEASATMGLLPQPHPGPEAKIWVSQGQVVAIGGPRPDPECTGHGFACVQALSDSLLKRIPPGRVGSIMSVYQEALAAGERIDTYIADCHWYDLGTPACYWQSHMDYLKRLDADQSLIAADEFGVFAYHGEKTPLHFIPAKETANSQILGPCLLYPPPQLATGASLGPFVVATDALTLEAEAHLSHSILCEPCLFPRATTTQHQLCSDGLQVKVTPHPSL